MLKTYVKEEKCLIDAAEEMPRKADAEECSRFTIFLKYYNRIGPTLNKSTTLDGFNQLSALVVVKQQKIYFRIRKL